jgi:hypothetical protein
MEEIASGFRRHYGSAIVTLRLEEFAQHFARFAPTIQPKGRHQLVSLSSPVTVNLLSVWHPACYGFIDPCCAFCLQRHASVNLTWRVRFKKCLDRIQPARTSCATNHQLPSNLVLSSSAVFGLPCLPPDFSRTASLGDRKENPANRWSNFH